MFPSNFAYNMIFITATMLSIGSIALSIIIKKRLSNQLTIKELSSHDWHVEKYLASTAIFS